MHNSIIEVCFYHNALIYGTQQYYEYTVPKQFYYILLQSDLEIYIPLFGKIFDHTKTHLRKKSHSHIKHKHIIYELIDYLYG